MVIVVPIGLFEIVQYIVFKTCLGWRHIRFSY